MVLIRFNTIAKESGSRHHRGRRSLHVHDCARYIHKCPSDHRRRSLCLAVIAENVRTILSLITEGVQEKNNCVNAELKP